MKKNMPTEAEVQAVIDGHPKSCFRTIMPKLDKMFGGSAPDWAWHRLEVVRPDCGMDCDEGCPVSGHAEG